MVQAFNFNQDLLNQRAAFMSANIMNVWLDKKDKVTPDKLLGKKAKALSAEEIERERKALKEIFKL